MGAGTGTLVETLSHSALGGCCSSNVYRVHCTNTLSFDEARISTKRRIVKIIFLKNVPTFINFSMNPSQATPLRGGWALLGILISAPRGGEVGVGEWKRGPKAWGPRLGRGGKKEGGIRAELHGCWCVWGGGRAVSLPFFSALCSILGLGATRGMGGLWCYGTRFGVTCIAKPRLFSVLFFT